MKTQKSIYSSLTRLLARARSNQSALQRTTATGVLLAGLFTLLAPLAAFAANDVWSTGGSSANFNLAGNWSLGIPTATSMLEFGTASSSGASLNNDITSGSFAGIQIDSTAPAYTIGGNAFTLGTGGINMSLAANNLTIGAGLTLGAGSQTWNVASGKTLAVSGTFTRSTGQTLVDGSGSTTYANLGTVTFNTFPNLVNNVLPWGFVVSSGTAGNGTTAGYNFATSGGTGSKNNVAYAAATAVTTSYPASAATVNYDWSATGTQSAIGSSRAANTIRFTGTSSVVQQDNSTQTETFAALMNAGGGSVTLGGGAQIMNITAPSGELVLAAMNNGIIINGPIINAIAVTIVGPNTVTFGGANTFTGNLNVNSGTLAIGGPALGSILDTTSQSSGVGNIGTTPARSLIVNGGTLSLTAGNLLGTGGSANTLSAITLVVNAGGVFQNGANAAGAGWWNKIGAINLNGGTISVGSGANNGAFQGLALIGTVTVGGTTASTINNLASSDSAYNGIHLGQNATASQSITFNVADVTGDANADLTISAKLLNTSSSLTASGLTKSGAGTMLLTGVNAYTGNTTISASGGTLTIGGAGQLAGGSYAGAISIGSSASFNYNSSAAQTLSGAISGNGTFEVSGSGVVTLFSASTLSSSTAAAVDGGTTLSMSGVSGTTQLTPTTLTLGSGSTGCTLKFSSIQNAVTTPTPTVDKPVLSSGSALTANGTQTIYITSISGSVAAGNYYPLIGNTGIGSTVANPRGYNLVQQPSGVQGHLVNVHGSDVLYYYIDSVADVWSNAGGTGNWNATDGNWTTSVGAGQPYVAGDKTLFNDSLTAGNYTITISPAAVAPAAMSVSADSANYTIDSTSNPINDKGGNTTAVTKIGNSTLTLKGANNYGGGTALTAGTSGGQLNINNNSALGTGTFTINSGTIDNTSSGDVTLGSIAQNWNGNFTYAGSANNLNLGSGAVTLNTAPTVTVSAKSLEADGAISGSYGVTKSGGGTLVLGGNNSNNGQTTVSAGTLTLQGNNSSMVGGVTLSAGELNINNNNAVGSGTLTISGGSIDDTASSVTLGTIAQSWNGDFTYVGSVPANTLNLGNGAVTMSATRQVTVTAGTLAVGGIISGSGLGLNKIGAGTLTLAGANTFSGTVTFNSTSAGTLVIANPLALLNASRVTILGGSTGTLDFQTDGSEPATKLGMSSGATFLNLVSDRGTSGAGINHPLSVLAGNGLGGGTLNFTSGANVASGTGGFTFDSLGLGAGSVQNTILNPTTASVSIGAVSKFNNNVSQTLQLDGTRVDSQITGIIANGSVLSGNTISLTKANTGTWTLSGQNTYSGATTINNGGLVGQVGGGCASSAVSLAATSGNAAVLGVSIADNTKQWTCSSLTVNNAGTSSTLDFNFGSVAPATSAGAAPLKITGAATFTTTPNVTVELLAANVAAGQSYPLATFASSSGTAPTSVTLNASGRSATVTGHLTASSTALTLVIDAVTTTEPLSWTGGDGSWDVNNSGNLIWKDSASASTYYQLADTVVFDNTIGSGGTVTLNTSVSPSGITVNNPSATYTISGSGTIAGSTSLAKSGTGTLTLSTANSYNGGTTLNNGELDLGSATALGSSSSALAVNGGILDLKGNNVTVGAVTIAGGTVQNSGGTATLTGSSFTANNSGAAVVSVSLAGSGSLTKTGNGTLTLSGANNALAGAMSVNAGALSVMGTSGFGVNPSYVGYLTGSGALTMSSGTLNLGGELRVGGSDQNGSSFNAVGTVTLNGGTVNVSALTVARGNYLDNSVAGTVTLNSGSIMVSTNDVFLEYAGTGLGKLAINGGTFTIGPAAAKWFMVGGYDTGSGELDIASGNFNLENGSSIKLCRFNNSGGNVVNQNGGNVTFYSDAGTTIGGGGQLDLNYNSNAGTPVNAYNLNGGILTVPQIVSSSSVGTRTFNFNGGTLQAANNNATFMNLGPGSAAANVRNGGAILDTAEFNVTVSQALQHSVIDGDNATDGGLTKNGSGILTLSAASTYTGNTTINAGTLALGSSGSINATPQISIAAGATLDVSAISSFTLSSSTTLIAAGTAVAATINGASGGTVSLGSQPITLAYDGLHPTLTISQGTLSLNGNAFTVNSASALASGTYVIAQQTTGNIATSGAFTVSGTVIDITHYGTISVSGGNVNLTVALKPTVAGKTYSRAPGVAMKIYASDLAATAMVDSSPNYTATFDHCDSTTLNGVTLENNGQSGNDAIILYPGNVANTGDSFSYTINDGHGGTASGTVIINIDHNVTGQRATITLSNGVATMKFFGVPGYHYMVQKASSVNGTYSDYTAITSDAIVVNGVITAPTSGGAFTVYDSDTSGSEGYYQLRAAP